MQPPPLPPATSSPAPTRRASPSKRSASYGMGGTASPARRSRQPSPVLKLPSHPIIVGVLALQGAFREHLQLLNKAARQLELGDSSSLAPGSSGFSAIHVRTPEDLRLCHALVIPGGESTAIALGAKRAGLLDDLRRWVANDKPTWGTCAGMILLAREASGGKRGGQELIGGMDVRVGRNGFGSQVDSFETQLAIPEIGGEPFPAVFIRAPVVDCLLDPEVPSTPTNEKPSSTTESSKVDGSEAPLLEKVNGAVLPLRTLPLVVAPSLAPYRASSSSVPLAPSGTATTEPTEKDLAALNASSIANPPGAGAEAPRPPLQILASLAQPVTSPVLETAPANPAALSNDGSTQSSGQPKLAGLVPRPAFDNQIVALRQGNLMSTSFHPELTPDARLHIYFLKDVVLPTLVSAEAST